MTVAPTDVPPLARLAQSLIGSSDDNGDTDIGKLHVTYYGNFFTNVESRLPSLRFGTGHVFNK